MVGVGVKVAVIIGVDVGVIDTVGVGVGVSSAKTDVGRKNMDKKTKETVTRQKIHSFLSIFFYP
jgi:hypothetical protein